MAFDKGPKSNEFRSIPSKRSWREREFVRHALDDLQKQFPVKDEGDIERLILTLKNEIKRIHAHLAAINQAHRDSGKEVDRKMFRDEAQSQFIRALSAYNKDELHLLFTCVLSDLAAKEFA